MAGFFDTAFELLCNAQSWQCWHFCVILLKFENKIDKEINHFNLNSKHYVKRKSALKLNRLLTIYNLFPFEVVQKCQHCQLCVYYGKTRIVWNFSFF